MFCECAASIAIIKEVIRSTSHPAHLLGLGTVSLFLPFYPDSGPAEKSLFVLSSLCLFMSCPFTYHDLLFPLAGNHLTGKLAEN